ncbi:uncharacterized protein LOC143194348 [Rhynchophorus ferrugineus]|uniref:uncharacterized protein LOC143194348 n=1 Tax=Rhynchophorus ferrugineus TaxID=354439 RepID=UPI003FCD077E
MTSNMKPVIISNYHHTYVASDGNDGDCSRFIYVVWRPPRPFRPPPIHHQQLQRFATPVDWYHAVSGYKRPSGRRLALFSYHRPPVIVPLPQRYRTSFTLT